MEIDNSVRKLEASTGRKFEEILEEKIEPNRKLEKNTKSKLEIDKRTNETKIENNGRKLESIIDSVHVGRIY